MAAKFYEITFPDGGTERVVNLKQFCQKYGLDQGHMSKVALGHRSHHKGYMIKTLDANGSADEKRQKAKEQKILEVCQKLVQTPMLELDRQQKDMLIVTLYAIEKMYGYFE